ncbi:MAG TPA: hypothetical protein VMZ26_12970 [Pyrinomonadaceae bacterium]|nr:hypothetical protein [Pyrinomonadaceae bacterium]
MALPSEVITKLEAFLNGMAARPGLEASTVAELSAITFRVTHSATSASQTDIDNFAVNDFPIHFLTATGVFQSSSDDIVKLMVDHRIPEQTFVGRREPGLLNPVPLVVFTYRTVERDWDEVPGVLGFGFPGTYLVNENQRRCRKVGIIKMHGFMTENLPQSQWKKKLLSVLRHELGHMMGLRHEDNSLMDGQYDVNVNFDQFTADQLWIVGRALTRLIQP